MFQITTKMEVNIRRGKTAATDMFQLSTFLIKSRIPAVVVEPEFVENILIDRSKYVNAYKVICAVDFHNGKHFALEKIRDLPQAALSADGFEILVSPNRPDKESLNELRGLTQFFKSIDPMKEIRWVLGLRTREIPNLECILEHMRTWPGSFIRTDTNLEIPSLGIDDYIEDIDFIRSKVSTPIKVSGNVDFALINALSDVASRFDVTATQARKIAREAHAAEQAPPAPPVLASPEAPEQGQAQDVVGPPNPPKPDRPMKFG